MHVTKHAAELCALLVNDLYGELPSRVLASLFTSGRSTLQQLAQYTTLPLRQIRHGVAVLLQQNLLHYQIDHSSRTAFYDANSTACYNLIRHGKIVAVVDKNYGRAEREAVERILLLGQAKVSDLELAFVPREGTGAAKHTHTNGTNGGPAYDPQATRSGRDRPIQTADELHDVLARLIRHDILEEVGSWTFESAEDTYHRIVDEIANVRPGEKAPKKTEQQEEIQRRLREAADRSKMLKRRLSKPPVMSTKRRKLANGITESWSDGVECADRIDATTVLRVNENKCLVELRNRQLSKFAADVLGEVTGQVYHVLLCLLTAELSRCRPDPRLNHDDHEGEDGDSGPPAEPRISTVQIFDMLDGSVDVSSGIGKASSDKIDTRMAEKVRTRPTLGRADSEDSDSDEPLVQGYNGDDMDVDFDVDEDEDDFGGASSDDHSRPSKRWRGQNGGRHARVTFSDGTTPKDSRLAAMRQHLLLLAESKHRFVRHCGSHNRGMWTVDFEPLVQSLQEAEIDAVIEQSFGRHGLRLTRILRDKGKMDDKELPLMAMMKKTDVQTTMLAMQVAGFVDVQEVPRSTNHKARDVIHLRFFDLERTQSRLLDNLYKAMVRCLQSLALQRHKERNLLGWVERKDVRGKEDEEMDTAHYNKYTKHLELQSKLLGQVMRLDDLVAMLQDF